MLLFNLGFDIPKFIGLWGLFFVIPYFLLYISIVTQFSMLAADIVLLMLKTSGNLRNFQLHVKEETSEISIFKVHLQRPSH